MATRHVTIVALAVGATLLLTHAHAYRQAADRSRAAGSSSRQGSGFPTLTGPYLGQTPPGGAPRLFAAGIVSTLHFEHSSPTFAPDGRTVLWSVHYPEDAPHPRPILVMTLEDGRWTEPRAAPFVRKDFAYENPFFSPDGTRVYFSATPSVQGTRDHSRSDLFAVDHRAGAWSEQRKLGSPPNSDNIDAQPSVTRDGTLYFISFHKPASNGYALHVARQTGGRYSTPVLLDRRFNSLEADWTPYVAPDESYLIFSSFRAGGFGQGDLYISFRGAGGKWGDVINMGPSVNTDRNDRFPNVTPDGKYLFFNSTRTIPGASAQDPGNGNGDVYWIDAAIIEALRVRQAKVR